MPRRIPVEEWDGIVALVAPHRDGVGVAEIRDGLGPGHSERTLQRRLSRLAAEGRIVASGTTRGKRYFPAAGHRVGGAGLPQVLSIGTGIPVKAGRPARAAVKGRKPRPPRPVVTDFGVASMVRGRAQGPCVALLLDSERALLIETVVGMMREQGWQALDLRFFGRTLPRGLVPDGLLTSFDPGEPPVKGLHALGCPIVRLGIRLAAGDHVLPAVVEDRAAAGRMAAEHFAERRFRHVGFVGFGDLDENRAMYEALRDRAAELGCACHLLKHRTFSEEENALQAREHRRMRREELAQWLRGVPKPIGMLAWSDNHGGRILAALIEAGLMAPSEVAVLGYGNKPSECECTPVPLSSIDPGIETQARAAVGLMQRLLAREPLPEKTVWVPPVGIQVRESTDALAVVDPLVARALRYMWDHIDRDLGSDDLAEAMGVSRRTLERVFRKHLGSSIRSELLRRRIEQLKLLLQTTDLPVADLATRVGFNSAQYMSNAFRRTVGMSPKQYRRISREQDDAQSGFWRASAQSE